MSKPKVVVGSKNRVKVGAIKSIFTNFDVISQDVPSGVSSQPFGDDETIQGAINRAKAAQAFGEVGIGLEGGIVQTQFGMLVVSYGALVDANNQLYIAGGTRIPLPEEVSKQLLPGVELGEVMDQYANKVNVKHDEGAVGIFTGNLVKRQDLFEHIAKLLLGQMLTGQNSVLAKE